jgi:uroporphyrinogen-III synthase
VLEVPTITVEPPADGGAALAAALAALEGLDWLVVTSVNGARAVAGSLAGRAAGSPQVAAVGPGTAAALEEGGVPVALVPARSVGEGLVEVFPAGPGRVLAAQAEGARPVVEDGLRAKGWEVQRVDAYRTVPRPVPTELAQRARDADAIAFTSASTVRSFVTAAGAGGVPPVVVCIGPVTAEAARESGLAVAAVAARHDLDGLVDAVVEALVHHTAG